jgi:hypothetical protein
MKNPPRMEECEGNRTCGKGIEGGEGNHIRTSRKKKKLHEWRFFLKKYLCLYFCMLLEKFCSFSL